MRRFIDAWAALDVEAAMACLAPNIVYVNQPLEPVVGLANVRRIIQGILEQTKRVEWKLLNVFGRSNTICTERLDCWDFDSKGWGLKLTCLGMFDLDSESKICGWRDYFDNQLWFKNRARIVKRTVFSARRENPEEFAELRAGSRSPVRHQARKAARHARFSCEPWIVRRHYRLTGGAEQIRTSGTTNGTS